MSIEFASTVINYGVLLLWFLVFLLGHEWLRHLHGRWLRLSDDQFDALHYAGMSMYKIGTLLFNLVPCFNYPQLRIHLG